jgi:hypothetical protein
MTIVERLRAMAQGEARSGIGRRRWVLFREAADEIERLRTELFEVMEEAERRQEMRLSEFAKARNAALEEAAKVAESYEPRCDTCPRGAPDAIRALKRHPKIIVGSRKVWEAMGKIISEEDRG